jgi:apolipoprotein N-acyltransferase
VALRDQRVPGAFGLGWVSGFVAFLGITHWVVPTLTRGGGLPLGLALAAHAAMAGILASYAGTFAAAVAWAAGRDLPVVWLAPAYWVTTEWLRGWLVVGFPWAPLGTSQHRFAAVAQLAEVTGVPGLSALVVLVNATLGAVLVRGGAGRRVPPRAALGLVAALVTTVVVGGHLRGATLRQRPGDGILRVGVIQGVVEQRRQWDPTARDALLARYLGLTRRVAQDAPDVIVWPELATPFAFSQDQDGRAAIERVVHETGVPLLFGSPAGQHRPDGPPRHFNRAYLLDRAGAVRATYDKIQLVPFGEYVPFRRLLPFLTPLAAGGTPLTPGTQATVFPVGEARLGVLVCYETVFPSLARRLVARGATVLVNLTHDGWFAGTAGVEQSLAQATFRAIEHRVPLVRVASTGVSAVIDVDGGVRWRAEPYAWVAQTVEVGGARIHTLYARCGDAAIVAAVLTTGLGFLAGWGRARKRPRRRVRAAPGTRDI